MKQLGISDYQKLNESFHKRLVYHLGIDCGFFAELNHMINAMLYCLAKGYRFQLYSEDANFGTGKGWTEYFQPFCEEVHEPFHHRYNLRRQSIWRRILAHWLAFRTYGEYVIRTGGQSPCDWLMGSGLIKVQITDIKLCSNASVV